MNEQDKRARRSSSDDDYWSSLFKQEDIVAPRITPADDSWTAIGRPIEDGEAWLAGREQSRGQSWYEAEQALETDEVLALRVVGYNKGGLLVRFNELQGFVPASQLVDFPQFHVVRERLRALAEWQGRTLKLKVIEVNAKNNRLILSERAALVKAETREGLLDQIRKGNTVKGEVTNLTDFGAFVDLGGIEGLVHISELSWSRVTHPSTILEPGQEVEALVLSIDRQEERIALSLKRLRRDPWQGVEERYPVGGLVHGTVSNVVSFGAFVALEEELEGLIHISELAEGTFLHPRNVVRKGDQITARVLHVDGSKKRLALSMRGVDSPLQSVDGHGEE